MFVKKVGALAAVVAVFVYSASHLKERPLGDLPIVVRHGAQPGVEWKVCRLNE